MIDLLLGRRLGNKWDELKFRLRNGYWCEHVAYGDWHMANIGANKFRFCKGCRRMEWV